MSTAGSEVDILDMLTVGAAIKKGGGTEREIDLFLNLVFGETNNKAQRRWKNSVTSRESGSVYWKRLQSAVLIHGPQIRKEILRRI